MAARRLSTPAPAESVGPGETPLLGQPQPDMGRSHIIPGTVQTYTYCPPASGFHVNAAGLGPIQPRFYGPDDATEPEGWIHNMEHAGLVVLYSCAGGCPDDATLQKLQDFANPATFPASPICKIPAGVVGPVVARFDDMKTKFAAMVWDRIFLMDTFDPAQVLTFFQQFGDTTEPEPQVQCTAGVAVAVRRTVGGTVGELVRRPVRRLGRPGGSSLRAGVRSRAGARPRAAARRPRPPARRRARPPAPAPADKERTMRLLSHRDPATGKRSFGVVSADMVITAPELASVGGLDETDALLDTYWLLASDDWHARVKAAHHKCLAEGLRGRTSASSPRPPRSRRPRRSSASA